MIVTAQNRLSCRVTRRAMVSLIAAVVPGTRLSAQGTPAPGVPSRLVFDGREFHWRWSRDGQHEFTPERETDLARWMNMVTVNVHPSVRDAEALARLANAILGNYRRHGRVMKTASKPARPDSPAEHMITAVLEQPGLLEAAFTRIFLLRQRGFVLTYSYRIYRDNAGAAMTNWLNANGNRLESVLVAWRDFDRIEPLAAG